MKPPPSSGHPVPMVPRGAKTNSLVATAATALALIGGWAPAVAQNEATRAPASLEELMTEGGGVYRNQCARCHGRNGEGQRHGNDAAPRLGGNFAQISFDEFAAQVIRGGSYMPPFGGLSNREIAAVATYVRNSFGNDYGIVSEQEVAENR